MFITMRNTLKAIWPLPSDYSKLQVLHFSVKDTKLSKTKQLGLHELSALYMQSALSHALHCNAASSCPQPTIAAVQTQRFKVILYRLLSTGSLFYL